MSRPPNSATSPGFPNQITLNRSHQPTDDQVFEGFLSSFQKVQSSFAEIDDHLERLNRSKDEFIGLIDVAQEKRHSSAAESTYSVIKLNLQTITKNLEQMKVDLDAERPNLHEKETQIIETKISAFYVTLKDRIALAGQTYQSWKEAQKNKVKRQIRNLDAEQKFTDQQIEELVDEDPAVVQKMVSEQVFGKASARLQYAADDILEKCEGIRRLQRHVRELVDMMREISQMVALQGEQVNTIAMHVAEAKDMTRRGVENLVKAKENHSSSRSVG